MTGYGISIVFLSFIMIDSLLSRKKSANPSIGSLSIEILPEFGWPRGNQRIFGPGTLFQGKKKYIMNGKDAYFLQQA